MKQRSAVLVYLSVLMTSGLMSFYWLPRIASEFLQQATPTEAARRLRAARTAYVAATILWVVTLLIVAAVHLWVEPQTLFAYFFKPMFFAALGVTIGLFICQGLLVHRFSVLVGRGRARTSLVGAVLYPFFGSSQYSACSRRPMRSRRERMNSSQPGKDRNIYA